MITILAALALGQATTQSFDIRGDVSDMTRQSNGHIRMLVRALEKPNSGYDQAWIRVTPSTVVVDAKGRDARAMLRNRNHVGVVFTGPVAESYPVQATAKRVVVLQERFDASGVLSDLQRTPHGLRFSVRKARGQEVLAVATVAPTTEIFRVRNGRRIPATVRDLRAGQVVNMAYDGPVLLSMPPQGKAGVIVIH